MTFEFERIQSIKRAEENTIIETPYSEWHISNALE